MSEHGQMVAKLNFAAAAEEDPPLTLRARALVGVQRPEVLR